jgi:hypothetical protein
MKSALKFAALPPENAHNAAFFHERLRAAMKPLPFDVENWGRIGDFDFPFFHPRKLDPAKKNVLIAGGFHGEEPAGAWGIIHFLETASPRELQKHNLHFLPLVNPTGFNCNRRENDWGENPNEGFIGDKNKPSREGALLVEHLGKIVKASAAGFLSLHEDSDMHGAYLWMNERGCDEPGAVAKAILKTLSAHFGIFSGSIPHRDGEVMIANGIGFNATDDSFETLLINNGVPLTATPETPCHPDVPLPARIACARDVITAFIAST